jgi:hypothetical protein
MNNIIQHYNINPKVLQRNSPNLVLVPNGVIPSKNH